MGGLINQHPSYDRLINAEVQQKFGEDIQTGKVPRGALRPDGQVADTYDENPILNSIVYGVQFPDGQFQDHATNIIVEDMLKQVDLEGLLLNKMEGIVNYKT